MRTLIYAPATIVQPYVYPDEDAVYNHECIGWFESDTAQEWKHDSDSRTLIRTSGGVWLMREAWDEFQGHYPITEPNAVATFLKWGYHEAVVANFPEESISLPGQS